MPNSQTTGWPQTFRPSPDDWSWNACVGYGNEWFLFAEGFRKAAELLVLHVDATRSNQNSLVYPIVFNYRQALELVLKRLNLSVCRLFERELKLPRSHALHPLFAASRPFFEKVWGHGEAARLDGIGDFLREFDAFDPKGTSFRYPVDFDFSPTMPSNALVDILGFAERADAAFEFLSGCEGGIASAYEAVSGYAMS